MLTTGVPAIFYLEVCRFDDFTYNKAIQKMVESHRISIENKQKLKALKRK